MNKTIVLTICLMIISMAVGAQTLGEKYKLPEEVGELRSDGVYQLPTSLLTDSKVSVDAYFRFFPDGTFIVYHSRVTPEEKPMNFQANCNYDFISSTAEPFNKDYRLKSSGNISRGRIMYPDKFIVLEMDVRKDVIGATIKTFTLDGKRLAEPVEYVMPFYQLAWPTNG